MKLQKEFENKRNAIQFLVKSLPDNGIVYNDCFKLMNGIKVKNTGVVCRGTIYQYENVSGDTKATIYKTKQSRYSAITKEVRHNCVGYMVQIEIN